MRKIIYLLVVALIVPFLGGCGRKEISRVTIVPLGEAKGQIVIPWEEPDVNAVLKPYSIKSDLSNILNISSVQDMGTFDRSMLARYDFTVQHPDSLYEQPFEIYEDNAREGVPNFITSDSIMHAYHLLGNYVIRSVEKEKLKEELKEFTRDSFEKSLQIYDGTREASIKKSALKNVAYFGIAMRLMNIGLPGGVPLEANRIIDNDVKKVKSRWGSGSSEIFPYTLDYKVYVPGGYYVSDTGLRNYFMTMMWYGSTPLYFDMDNNGSVKRLDEQIVMSIIMTSQTLGDSNLRRLWDDIYKISSACYGNGADITIYDMSNIINTVYGSQIDLNKIWDEEKIEKVYEMASSRYKTHMEETISSQLNSSSGGSMGQVGMRLFGMMYSLDDGIYDNLTSTGDDSGSGSRPLPMGLDIPSVFGSDRACAIVKEEMGEEKNQWDGYSVKLEEMKSVMSQSRSDSPDEYSFTNSIFWALKGYSKEQAQGYPSFMLNDNWDNKKLVTFMSSVSDWNHAAYLVSKSGSVKKEENKAETAGVMPGYVEPAVSLYSRLEYICNYMEDSFKSSGVKSQGVYKAIEDFAVSATFLKDVSLKELADEPLSKEDEEMIRGYGGELKSMTLDVLESKGAAKHWELVSSGEEYGCGHGRVCKRQPGASDCHRFSRIYICCCTL